MAPPNPESAAALFIHFSFSQVHGRGGEEEAEEEAEEEEEKEEETEEDERGGRGGRGKEEEEEERRRSRAFASPCRLSASRLDPRHEKTGGVPQWRVRLAACPSCA